MAITQVPMGWEITGHKRGLTLFRFIGNGLATGQAGAMIASVENFATRLRGQVPNEVLWRFGPQLGNPDVAGVTVLDETTGEIIGTDDDLPVALPKRGIGTGRWMDGIGIRLEVLAGPPPGEIRPLLGHYKLVPWIGLGGAAGRPIESALTAPRNSMSAWLTDANTAGIAPCVWRRPQPGRPGLALPVTSTRVRPRFTQMTRHRRRINTFGA